MHGTFPYDQSEFHLELPERAVSRIVGERYPEAPPDPEGEVLRALERPVDSPSLAACVPPAGRISICIADITRGSGLGGVLSAVLSYLEGAGAGPDRVGIVLATGMHRGHDPSELERHLGSGVVSRWKVTEHDARNGVSLVDAGRTPAGTPCRFSGDVASSSLVICIGSISFHYFAGFGGGRKLILPGVAAEETILANHRLSLAADPAMGLAVGCAPANLDGNPVHEDMLAGARLLGAPIFAVNAICDSGGALLFVNAGELDRSHRLAAAEMLRNFSIPIDRRYGMVVVSAGGYPKDINLLQSHKAIRHASYALRDGGTMLAVAACREGIGSPSLSEAFGAGRNGVTAAVRRRYTLNAQAAVSTFQLTGAYDIHLKSMLPDEEAARFGFTPWNGERIGSFLAAAPPGDILVIMNGSAFLPRPAAGR